ncbi:MAG: peroxiredoxin [Anaerolineales bacterium]|nr:peroxiredoxin [Anaerolineales bacterium]MCB9126428.1 peroxiredoxin [Ardenticatenales bacterium]MCB9171589.1 peroxiredoxin [Ardenticatenales bacterium]
MISIGNDAPDFTLTDQDNDSHTLSDYRGQPVVLLFYPLDFSAVCTNEMACVMDMMAQFNELNAQIFGISVDSRYSHKAFADARGIEYPLLADFHPKGAVAQAYDVYLDHAGISSRAWFVIDGAGTIVAGKDVGPPNLPDFEAIVEAIESARD